MNNLSKEKTIEKTIYTEIEFDTLKGLLENKETTQTVIIKLGATWCKPCQNIKHHCHDWFQKMPGNVYCFDLDVDDHFEIFGTLKSKRMVTTIPALLCFYGNSDRNSWFAPDISISSSNPDDLNVFFSKIINQISLQTLNI
jgi:thioredoxin-like negative regulator of GroEL